LKGNWFDVEFQIDCDLVIQGGRSHKTIDEVCQFPKVCKQIFSKILSFRICHHILFFSSFLKWHAAWQSLWFTHFYIFISCSNSCSAVSYFLFIHSFCTIFAKTLLRYELWKLRFFLKKSVKKDGKIKFFRFLLLVYGNGYQSSCVWTSYSVYSFFVSF